MILFFTAKWCPQCKMMKPMVEEFIKEGYDIKIMDADADIALAETYGIMSIPIFICENEHGINTLDGLKTKEEVLKFIKNNTKL